MTEEGARVPSEFSIPDMFESVAAAVPDRVAIVAPARQVTYAALDDEADRLAGHLSAHGVGAGDHVAILALNCPEWLVALLAIFKLRAVSINVNHRYVTDELRYLFDNADVTAAVVQRRFAGALGAVRADLPLLHHVVVIDDDTAGDIPADTTSYADAVAHEPMTDALRAGRSGDDPYIMYTGGTTGMPKGVLWRQEDFFFAALRGGALGTLPAVSRPGELAERAVAIKRPVRWLLPAPLHHAGGQWGTLSALLTGQTLIQWTGAHFDADAIWKLVETHRAHNLGIIGDAMARPLAEALAATPYNTSSLLSFGSGGAVFSPAVKDQLHRVLPDVPLMESLGSTETGLDTVSLQGESDRVTGARPRFALTEDMAVFDEDLRPVQPGSGVLGFLARRGHVPLGYYKDPDRTAKTFPVIDGVRYSIPGDYARVDEDGSVVLLGRGSISINSGGEKVWPEEVESVLKQHPDVFDAVVVGVADERWGQHVAAVVAPRLGATLTSDDLTAHCRGKLADYKRPRQWHLVGEVVRQPSGKPDYRWAADVAASETVAG